MLTTYWILPEKQRLQKALKNTNERYQGLSEDVKNKKCQNACEK